MANFADLPTVGTLRLDRTLEAAVQASWNELMPSAEAGAIQIEYRVESDGALQYLRILGSTTRGYWNLICEQWMTASWSHVPGLLFSGNHYSENLAHLLEIVARRRDAFVNVSGTSRNGSLYISPPSEDERRIALRLVADVFTDLGSSPVEQLITAWTGGHPEIAAD